MSTTISRTWYDTLIDDAGGGTDGTILDKADFDALLDAIDGLFSANLSIDSMVLIRDTANTFMTTGLTINQLGADNEIFAAKSSDVAHGVTSIVETDTYFTIGKVAATGIAWLRGFGPSTAGMWIEATCVTDDIVKNGGAAAPLLLNAAKKSGAGQGAVGADGNLVAIANNQTVVWLVDEDGDTYRDGTDNTFDAYDDPMLALAFEKAMNPAAQLDHVFNGYCQYNNASLVEAGILAPPDPKTGRQFYNESALLRLATGSAWQLAHRQHQQAARIAALENTVRQLGGGES